MKKIIGGLALATLMGGMHCSTFSAAHGYCVCGEGSVVY